MTERDHDAIEELLAIRALGGLDGEDVATLELALADHGDCGSCRALETEFAATAALLAASLDPVDVDPVVADRILAAARASEVVAPISGRRSTRRPWTALIAVAAALVLVVGGLVVRGGTQPIEGTTWAQEIVHFEGEGEGDLAMAYVPGTPGAAFWGANLPDPGEGRTYEIWMIDDETPVSGGCVSPVDGNVAVFVPADVGTTELMAVTVEPAACPAAPTGEIALTAQLA